MAASRDLAHRARGLAAQARRATPASARPTTSWVPRGSSSPTRSTSARACRLARRSGRATPPTARATTARRAPRPATTTVRRRARGPRWGQCWSQWWDLYWDLYWNQSVGSARAPYGGSGCCPDRRRVSVGRSPRRPGAPLLQLQRRLHRGGPRRRGSPGAKRDWSQTARGESAARRM